LAKDYRPLSPKGGKAKDENFMSKELEQIKDELDLFASKRGPAALVAAKVLSFNETDSTVEVELENKATIDDVQLRSVVNNEDKVVLIPKEGSIILMAAINNSSEYYVVAVEAVKKILIKKGNLEITIDDKVKIDKAGDSLKQAFVKSIEATQQIVVLQGNNPDYVKLAAALATINNIMN
jgi:hypothetical protein